MPQEDTYAGTVVRIAFLLTQQELKQARYLVYHRLRTRGERLTDYASLTMAVALLIPNALLIYRGHMRNWEDFCFPLLPIVFALIAGRTWRQHHQFANQSDYSQEQTLEIEEDGIFRATAQGRSVKLPWTKISRYTESEDMFLLASPWPWGTEAELKGTWRNAWMPKPVLVILPKRTLGPADAERLRDLLDRKLSIWAKQRSLRAVPAHSSL